MAVKPKTLTPKERLFVAEYLVTLNASDAHRKVGFSGKSHAVLGHRLLTKVNVTAAIADAQAKRLENAGISAEHVLKEITKVGFASMRRIMVIGSDGQPQINLSSTPDDDLDALLEIQTRTSRAPIRRDELLGDTA